MLEDKDSLPEPTHIEAVMSQLQSSEIVALIEPDIFSVKAQQEDKAIRINITVPASSKTSSTLPKLLVP